MLASFILLLAAFAFAAELEITTTHEVFCTRKTVVGDTISVHYRGTLPAIPGHETEVFDSSYDRKPSKPFMFTLGKGQVITGWDQGLLDMCIGEKRNLVIPPNLAYGSGRAVGSCATDCTLLFETELMSIEGVDSAVAGEPVDEVKKVSARQDGLDHVILIFSGALALVSALMIYSCFWRKKGKGSYDAITLQNL